MKPPERIGHIVTRFSTLRQLSAQAEQLERLNQKVMSCLPPGLAGHVRVANLRDDCLVIQAESSAWASQIRYRAPEILQALNQLPAFASVQSIRVRNRATPLQPAAAPIQRRRMSTHAASGIAAQADATDDPSLRDALRKLSRRGEGQD